jgi:hypothetical protein
MNDEAEHLMFVAGFFLGLLFDLENGGSAFF